MFKAELWIFSTLFCLGVIGGLSFLLLSSSQVIPRADQMDPADGQQISARDSVKPTAEPSDFETSEELQDAIRARNAGDQFLITGNFNAAAERFQKVQKINGRFSSDISIRLGICAEQNRQPAIAANHYQRAIDQRPSEIHRRIAVVGLARAMTAQGNLRESLRTLCDLFLESLDSASMPEELRAQVVYQLGNVLQSNALADYHFDLSQPDGVGFHYTEPEVTALLNLLEEKPNESREPTGDLPPIVEPGKPQIAVLQRPTNSINLMLVDVTSTMQPIEVLTRHLAAAGELELLASPRAESLIQGRSKSLRVKSVPTSLLFDALLIPLNLGWQQTDDQIRIFSLDEVPATESKQFWMAATERNLRRFNLAFPGDYRGQSALLSRANLKFIQSDIDGAANHYQELSNQRPKDEMLARLFFNLGKVHLRTGRNDEATRQFFYAVDQSYNPGFQSTGYWLAGQLLLETQQLESAIKAAGRSLATARDDQQIRLAALTMARAYLLSNQPYAANQILFDNRGSFAGSDQQQVAAVLGSYARYVGVTDQNSLNAEGNRMLAAVAMVSEKSFDNFIDIYIAGRAYQELGFQEKAVEKLTLAADSTTIAAWRRQILFELAIQLMISDRLDEAAPVFEFLISGEDDQWQLKSLLQLAQVYVRQQQFKDAIDICEKLLNRELTEADKQTTLNTMGRAYRKLGEDHSAALCFAGVLPTKTVD